MHHTGLRVILLSSLAPLLLAAGDVVPGIAKSADTFVDSIGVNVHIHYNDTAYDKFDDIIKPRLIELGLRHVRDGAVDSTWEKYYARHQALGAAGIKCVFIFDPMFAISRIRQFVPRVGDLEAFEGPNEYDLRGIHNWQYVLYDYQRSLHQFVKGDATLAAFPVYGPSLVHAPSYKALADYKPDGAVSQFMDFGNIHPYPGGRKPTEGLQHNLGLARQICAEKPIRPTETGYHNAVTSNDGHRPCSEAAAGKYIPRLFLEYFNAGMDRTYTYEFIDLFPDTVKPDFPLHEKHFGLLHNDGSPKPAFTALKHLLALLKDPGPAHKPGALEFTLEDAAKETHHTLLQKRDGRFYLILWQEVSCFDIPKRSDITNADAVVTLTLTAPAKKIATYLPLTGPAAVETKENAAQVKLNVPDHVLVVEITTP